MSPSATSLARSQNCEILLSSDLRRDSTALSLETYSFDSSPATYACRIHIHNVLWWVYVHKLAPPLI